MFILDGDFYSLAIDCLPGRHLIPNFMCGSGKPIGHMQAQPVVGTMLFILSITVRQRILYLGLFVLLMSS